MQADAIRRATVVGAGLMGADIAVVLSLAGIAVALVDICKSQLELAQARMRASMDSLVECQLATQAQAEEALRIVSGTTNRATAVEHTEFVVESVPEDLSLKQGIFAALDAEAPPEAILTQQHVFPVDHSDGCRYGTPGACGWQPLHLARDSASAGGSRSRRPDK